MSEYRAASAIHFPGRLFSYEVGKNASKILAQVDGNIIDYSVWLRDPSMGWRKQTGRFVGEYHVEWQD